MEKKLFAVYLGGRAPKCNTELHDVVFVVGERIEDTYERLMDKWFGTPKGLHLDSWMPLEVVDGYRIKISKTPPAGGRKLFFINLGAYLSGQFTEHHATAFIVARDEREVKARAKERLLVGMTSVHTDDLYDIDDCIELSEIDGHFIALEPTAEPEELSPTNGYQLVPKALVEEYMRRNGIGAYSTGANRGNP